MTQALLAWLVLYVGLLAVAGFILFVVRSATERHWANRGLLRAASMIAFVGSGALWLAIIAIGR